MLQITPFLSHTILRRWNPRYSGTWIPSFFREHLLLIVPRVHFHLMIKFRTLSGSTTILWIKSSFICQSLRFIPHSPFSVFHILYTFFMISKKFFMHLDSMHLHSSRSACPCTCSSALYLPAFCFCCLTLDFEPTRSLLPVSAAPDCSFCCVFSLSCSFFCPSFLRA